jgi:hypothetical protein
MTTGIRVACTVMLKDESVLVNPFLEYHADLFGAENLYVVDNGSTDPVVLEALRKFERVGVKVDRSHPTAADYAQKGTIIGDLVTRLDREGDHDFYVLLDCDEFVVLRLGDGYTCDPKAILDHLGGMRGETRILKVDTNLSNIPGWPGVFQSAPYAKTIFPRDVLLSTDHGHHIGTSRTGSGHLPCDIVYVHYHYRSFDEILRFARRKLAPMMPVEDLDDPKKLRRFRGIGNHMVGYMTGGADSYYGQFRNVQDPVRFPDLLARFKEIGVVVPFADIVVPPPLGKRGAEYAGQTELPGQPPCLVVDHVTTSRVRGWAMSVEAPDDPLVLRFLVDGTVVWTGACDATRSDVRASGHVAERVGFDVSLPLRLAGGILTIEENPGEPLTMMVGGRPQRETRLPSAEQGGGIYSHIDFFRAGRIQGWAMRSVATPEGERLLGACTVVLMCDDKAILQTRADLDRPDVANALGGERFCGFVIEVPPTTNQKGPVFRLFVMPEQRELIGSPCVAAPAFQQADAS